MNGKRPRGCARTECKKGEHMIGREVVGGQRKS